MKSFLFLLLISLILITSPSWGDEAAEHLRENSAGLNVMVTAEVPNVIQNVPPYTVAIVDTIVIDFPGIDDPLTTKDYSSGGILFTIAWKNNSAVADTVWRYWPNLVTKQDSSYILLEPGQGNARIGFVAEGDGLKIDKMGAGETLIYLGGAKNLIGASTNDF